MAVQTTEPSVTVVATMPGLENCGKTGAIEKVPIVSDPFPSFVVAVNWVGLAVKIVSGRPFSPVNVPKPDPITIVPDLRPLGAVTVTVPLEITTVLEIGANGLKVPHVP